MDCEARQSSSSEDFCESPDPRVMHELESMNAAMNTINMLEKELNEARDLFRRILSESTTQMNMLYKKNRKSIERTREYYKTLLQSRTTQSEAQNAALQFRRANSFYKAAKETIHLAEARLAEKDIEFDEAWQEMLNHSTMKMMEAEKDKMRSELEHHRKSQMYQELEAKVHTLEKSRKKSIQSAKPYYDMKATLELKLQQQKQNIDDLLKSVATAKLKYKTSMAQLEKISEEIHHKRKFYRLPSREPAAGCESDDDFTLEINLEKHLNIDASNSDDGINTDTSSLWSSDSNSANFYNPDAQSINSCDYDSAICSPKSLSLERTFSETLNFNNNSNTREYEGNFLNKTDLQKSTDTICDCDDSDESESSQGCRRNTLVPS